MTDFAPNIKFIGGQVFDIESKMANDSIPQIECGGQIPKYLLRYELSDSLLSIKSFCLEIELDQYGQIIDLGWPSYHYNTREDFVKPQAVLELALKYCKKKKYKTNERIDELVYDSNQNALYWNIHFVQKTYGNSESGSNEFVTIIIDARALTILYEYKNELAWTSNN